MNKKGLVLGIVPARAGSKGVPHKNMALLGGKPLIAHAIEVGLASQCDDVVLSTDSSKYEKVGLKYNAEVVKRPKNLARDTTPMISVLKHVVSRVEKKRGPIETVVILQPTSPFRKKKDIDRCLKILRDKKADSVVSVIKVPDRFNPCTIMMEKKQGLYFPLNPDYQYSRRQDMPDAYLRNGALYVFKRQLLNDTPATFFGKRTHKYLMDENYSINVDAAEDLKLARQLWSRWQRDLKRS